MTTVVQTPEGPIIIPLPRGANPPPLPHIANPLPRIVSGAEYVWGDVSGWVADGWHSVTGWLSSAESLTGDMVQTAIDNAISMSQTAWSSFVSQLEQWMTVGLIDAGNFTWNVLSAALEIRDALEAAIWTMGDALLRRLLEEVQGIDNILSGLEQLIYDAARVTEGALQAWAIDNIYHPLLGEIEAVRRDVFDAVGTIEGTIEGYVDDAVHAEALRRAAAIAGVVAAVATITTWIEECGEPTCATVGPRTDWGRWLKLFGPTAIWAMLAAVAAEDPSRIEDLAQTLGETLGPILEGWVTTFALGGGGFAPQPSDVGGAIGRNPLAL